VSHLLVGLTFNSVIYPPVANPDYIGITENTSADALNLLQNDAGTGLAVISVNPTNGTVIGGNQLLYTPPLNFIGTTNFTYVIVDNLGDTNSATVTVTVTNNPPLANPDSFSVAVSSVNNVFKPLTNDVAQTSGGTLSLVSITPDSHGSAVIDASGTNVVFTPTSAYTGMASIGYLVTDGVGGTNGSTITVTVGTVTAIPVTPQLSGTNLILTWNNSPFTFNLQYSTNVTGPYAIIPGATSPYTNLVGTNAAGFFRLVH
jgi:hypothetical protein